MYESLYLHIPFCKSRCAYCDFTTEALSQDDPKMDAYVEGLIGAIRAAVHDGSLAHIRTIYLGGGTPTHLGHGRLIELAYLLSLSINLEQVHEYTVEANPESLTSSLVKDLFALGVSRLSLGVQSFVDEELAALGRAHTAEQARTTVRVAQERFESISLDLMCGIPGQTKDTWQYSLEQALALSPTHLSIYPLHIEVGTALAQAIDDGRQEEPNEDEQAEFMEHAAGTLVEAGYHRYEVASYAKPGFESLHNTAYWSGSSYLGLGYGAASMLNNSDGTRQRCKGGEEPEVLSAAEAAAEDLFLAMRMSRGVESEQLLRASLLLPRTVEVFGELLKLGLVERVEGRYLPTHRGWLLGNELYARVWDLAIQK